MGIRAYTVLVVDGDPVIRELLDEVLTSEGYSVFVAENRDQVLSAFSEAEFRILLLDLALPGRDGLELLHDLRSADGAGYASDQLKILAVSGFATGCLLNAARVLGADAVLAKPIGFDELLNSMDELLQKDHKPDKAALNDAKAHIIGCQECLDWIRSVSCGDLTLANLIDAIGTSGVGCRVC